MKKFVLAAVAALSLGIGSAYAQNLMPSNYPQVVHNGPAFSSGYAGG